MPEGSMTLDDALERVRSYIDLPWDKYDAGEEGRLNRCVADVQSRLPQECWSILMARLGGKKCATKCGFFADDNFLGNFTDLLRALRVEDGLRRFLDSPPAEEPLDDIHRLDRLMGQTVRLSRSGRLHVQERLGFSRYLLDRSFDYFRKEVQRWKKARVA